MPAAVLAGDLENVMKKHSSEPSTASQVMEKMSGQKAKKAPTVKPFGGMGSTPVKGSTPFQKKK